MANRGLGNSAQPNGYQDWISFWTVHKFKVLSLAAAYDGVLPPVTSQAGTPVRFALSRIAEPYLFAGIGPGSYDCSGLVLAAYRAAWVNLPRVSQDQFYARPRLAANAPLRPGDLVGFGSPSDVSHIGIYIGSGLMIDAPHTGASIRIENFHWNDYVGPRDPAAATPARQPSRAGSGWRLTGLRRIRRWAGYPRRSRS